MATTEGRIIVTQDLDFGRLGEQGWTPAGLVLLRFPSTLCPSSVAEYFARRWLVGNAWRSFRRGGAGTPPSRIVGGAGGYRPPPRRDRRGHRQP
ncbi:DUF5615 family PIN-like protein [Geochorda subterranea]|uniref:DUF5615 family PIN-like protein n=1 Tax=Geochorda subterranea TaxID=3109564 RepID=UPI00386011E4